MRRWNASGWAIILACGCVAAALSSWAFVRWPIYTGGACLFTGAAALGAVGMWLACRDDVRQAEAAAVEAAATGRDLAAVGPITDRYATERALAKAVRQAWGVDAEPTEQDELDAHDLATALLDYLDTAGCRVVVPNTRRRPPPPLPTRDPEPAQPSRVPDPIPLWPGIGGPA